VASPPSRVKEEIIRERSVVCIVVFARRVLDDIIFVVVYASFARMENDEFPQSSRLALNKAMNEDDFEDDEAAFLRLSSLTPEELSKHTAKSRDALDLRLKRLSSLYESTELEFKEMERVKEKLLENVNKLREMTREEGEEEEEEEEEDGEIQRLERLLLEEKEKQRAMMMMTSNKK